MNLKLSWLLSASLNGCCTPSTRGHGTGYIIEDSRKKMFLDSMNPTVSWILTLEERGGNHESHSWMYTANLLIYNIQL